MYQVIIYFNKFTGRKRIAWKARFRRHTGDTFNVMVLIQLKINYLFYNLGSSRFIWSSGFSGASRFVKI